MDPNKRFITEISARDLRELAALTHLEGGDGIRVDVIDSGVRISIDRDKLRALLNTL